MKKDRGFFNKKQGVENAENDYETERKTVDDNVRDDAAPQQETENDEEKTEIEVLKEENQKLKDEFLRALAETENVKKRYAAEIEKNNRYAVSSFAKDLLGVADNLQRALSAGKAGDNPACESILQGVELTQNELNHVFAKFGIVPMEDVGKVFDPNYHRVVQEVEDKDKPNGTIVSQLQTGYLINGRILREAMVVVTKGGK